MKRTFWSLFSLCLLVLIQCPLPARADDAEPKTDLKPDPAITWGKLPNGIHYAIMKHERPGDDGKPSKHVSARLFVRAGSLMETDAEQGYAHFLEHMAFNGSKHFPDASLTKYFERLGMGFGADTNAETDFDRTIFQMELPDVGDQNLDGTLNYFRDIADGLLMDDKKLSKERGVVLSEKLDRDTFGFRCLGERINLGFGDALFAKRMPIGTTETLNRATRESLNTFWRRWYVPERITVVIVGPVDAKQMAKKITDKFADIEARKSPADPDFGKALAKEEIQYRSETDTAGSNTVITLDHWTPSNRPTETLATRRSDLIDSLTETMVNTRLQKLTMGEKPAFESAQIGSARLINHFNWYQTSVTCRPDQWKTALSSCQQELRRLVEFGFASSEIEEAKATVLQLQSQAAIASKTSTTNELADSLVRNIADHEILSRAEDDYEQAVPMVASITAEECVATLRRQWMGNGARLSLRGPTKIAEADLKSVYKDSQAVAVKAPKKSEKLVWAYAASGTPATVAEKKTIEDVDLTLIKLSNNVRLNLKPTQFEKDRTYVTVSFGGGRMTMPKGKSGLDFLAAQMFISGGLEKHSFVDINRLMANRNAAISFAVTDEQFSLRGMTNRKDLQFLMEAMFAYFHSPGYRTDRIGAYAASVDSIYDALKRDPDMALVVRAPGVLYCNDPRLAMPKRSEAKARNLAELRDWLTAESHDGWVEIGVVGDFDAKAVTDAVAATFGTLATRADARPDYKDERKLKLAAGPIEKHIAVQSPTPRASLAVMYPTIDRRHDIVAARTLSMLASILQRRLEDRIRRELGQAYSPSAFASMSDTFEDRGQLTCAVSCDKANASTVGPLVRELAAKLAAEGATADELDRAKKTVLNSIVQDEQDDAYWMDNVVSEAQSTPRTLAYHRSKHSDYESITLQDVNRMAKKYLTADRAISIYAEPAATTKQTALK